MANSEIRYGKVSSVDHEKGMVKVTYRDKDESVTTDFAVMNYNDEYRMPRIGQQVAVAHLSNGSSRGIVLGEIWNQKNLPRESGEDLYRKDLSKSKNAAYIRYNDRSGEYLVKAANLHLNGVNRTVLDGPELEMSANLSALLQTDEMAMDFPKLTVTSGDVDELYGQIKTNIKINQAEGKLEAVILKVLLELVEDVGIKAGTAAKIEAVDKIELSSSGELRLKDGKYNTTLTEIMDKLKALEG